MVQIPNSIVWDNVSDATSKKIELLFSKAKSAHLLFLGCMGIVPSMRYMHNAPVLKLGTALK